ncbi:MAG: helix-turn-helix transcriptional regulator [Chloroflexi bacterium]|uniref:helix-turn-helix domain-containing protein n=1 Tax=Candidatus Flexifilum breve TaxID=3140694 RepID=UPI003135A7AE|nr:helix-turn-helix transcriptional regulator [Chloroflexota bacterium]
MIEQLQRHLMPMFSRQVKPELIETLLVDFLELGQNRAGKAVSRVCVRRIDDYVGLSKNHFSRVFHKTTGVKFWDYVTQLRIEKAKELLKGSNRSNYEICREIGYESEFYFSKIFKKVVGVAAQEFRRL